MRRAATVLCLPALAACAGAEGAHAPGAFVLRAWTAPAAPGAAERCALADSAWQWRELRAAVPELERCGLACAFATERIVVVVASGPAAAAPVRHEWLREEDVDVLTIVLDAAPAAGTARVVHAMVVAARPAELAVVLRARAADGGHAERTLAVPRAR